MHAVVLLSRLKLEICVCLGSMFQRGAKPRSDDSIAPEVEFQDDVEDLFADNTISATRTATLLRKAQDAGIKIASKVIKKALHGVGKKFQKNAARSLRKEIRKDDKWPDPYWFDARVWSRKLDKEITTKICILLPSEVLEVIWTFGVKAVLLGTQHYDKLTKDHLEWMKQQLNVTDLWGFGLHGDGVPCNYDRSESVMLSSLNLPGLTGRNGRLRIPLCILPDHCISDNTFDDVYEILAWDMRSALSGVRHECRHDMSPWHKQKDKRRSQKHGAREFRSCLVQVRSDWEWLGKCYHFPGHASHNGLCWGCKVKRNQVLGETFGAGAFQPRRMLTDSNIPEAICLSPEAA